MFLRPIYCHLLITADESVDDPLWANELGEMFVVSLTFNLSSLIFHPLAAFRSLIV